MRKKKEYPDDLIKSILKGKKKAVRQSTTFEKFIGRFIGYSLLIVFLLFLIWLIKLLLVAIF